MTPEPFDYEEYKGFIKAMVHKYIKRTNPILYKQFDDLYHEAVEAFLTCHERYNPKYKAKPWIMRVVFNKLKNCVRSDVKYNKAKYEVREKPMDYEDVTDMDVSYATSLEFINFKHHKTSKEAYNDTLDDLLELYISKGGSIPEHQRRNLEAYLKCGSYVEAAHEVGVSKQAIEQSIKRLVKKLRKLVDKGV